MVAGESEHAGRRLTARQAAAMCVPAHEEELPVVFNEWCSSWGNPTHDGLVALADKLLGTPVKYLIIDDGWSRRSANSPQHNGDWDVDPRKFPRGLAATCAAMDRKHFGRFSPEQGKVPLATSRLAKSMAGENRRHYVIKTTSR